MDWGLGVAAATVATLGWAAIPQKRTVFRRCTKDWMAGTYVIGLPGTGKTIQLINWVLEHRKEKRGVIFVDVHDTCRRILEVLPSDEQVIYLAPWSDKVVGLNLLQRYSWTSDERYRLADSAVMLFKRLFKGSWGDAIEGVIYGAVLAVLEVSEKGKKEVTLVDALRMLLDEQERNRTLTAMAPSIIRSQLENTKWESASVQSSIRKIARSLSHDSLIACLAQPGGVNLLDVMNKGQLLLCDFDQEKLGEGTASFLAGLVMARVQNAAMSRPTDSKPCIVLADEFPCYVNDSFGLLIEHCRKRRVGLVMAHQSAKAQLSPRLQAAVKEAATHYYMRIQYDDATHAAKECGKKAKKQGWEHMNEGVNAFVEGLFGRKVERKAAPELSWEPTDFTTLPNYHAIAKELRSSVAYPAQVVKLPPPPEMVGAEAKLVAESNHLYAKDRATVLAAIQASFGGDDNTDGIDGRRKR